MTKTVVGLFDTQEQAEQAVNALIPLGYTNDQIGVALRGEIRAASASSNDPLLADAVATPDGMRKTLAEGATSGWNAQEYAEKLNYSGVVVTVQAEEAQVAELEQLLQQNGAVDLANRQPSRTLDPTEAAVQEADAVDRPATTAVASEVAQGSTSTGDSSPAPASNQPLASDAQVAATDPSGLATLRPGSGVPNENKVEGAQAGGPAAADHGGDAGAAPSTSTAGSGAARSYTGQPSYQPAAEPYLTPDLGAETRPAPELNTTPPNGTTGTEPEPHERDLTVSEPFGGSMEEPTAPMLQDETTEPV